MRILDRSFPLGRGLTVALLSAICLAEITCGRTNTSAPIPMTIVMQAVRDYGHGQQSTLLNSTKPPAAQDSANDPSNLDGPYQAHIGLIFAQGDFAQLEKIVHRVRIDKSRLSGGVWKLLGFYEGLSQPPAGDHSTDAEWSAHIDDLKKWTAAYPESATARIALARAYIHYAWFARGSGYSNSVSNSSWEPFGQRIALAKATLSLTQTAPSSILKLLVCLLANVTRTAIPSTACLGPKLNEVTPNSSASTALPT